MNRDDEPLPEVYEGELDGPLFEAYMADLAELVTLRSVQLREPGSRETESAIDLQQARMLMVLGRAPSVQIRYVHEGVAWVDTLFHRGATIHLVRMRA